MVLELINTADPQAFELALITLLEYLNGLQ